MDKADLKEGAKFLAQAFAKLGLSCEQSDMHETPMRVAKYVADFARNQGKQPKTTQQTVYPEDEIKITLFDHKPVDELIIERGIEYTSICAHHLLPFYGRATIGYLPNRVIIGASKIPRILDFFAHQPQTQEYLTQQVADFIREKTQARFVGAVLTGTHTCCSCRGVRKQGMEMVTSCFRPSNKPALKAEFLQLSGR